MTFFEKYKYPIIGAGIGLILAISFISFGFWKTTLALVFTALGAYLGLYLKKTGLLEQFRNRR
ncbi:DUF2273 domain-containing protein [Streptococcus halichoeri]|uniref:DUF2273 domain-containing protein n=1 Tax=Streptococcus halichoeri TaxID=254785 RepID=UPI001359EDE4|nr:DUF2273 domain-containing protein [Streptococcus halichoeri]